MTESPRDFTPDRSHINVAEDTSQAGPRHLRPDDEPPAFDVSRDPTPGVPDHAWPEDDEEATADGQ